jgi:hypothetical protein
MANNKIPYPLFLYLDKEDIKILEEYFVITQPDLLGKTPHRYLTIIGDEWYVRDVFRKLSSRLNGIDQLNQSWSRARLNKQKDQNIVSILINWDILDLNDPPNYGLQLSGFAQYFNKEEGYEVLDNFKYNLELLKQNIKINPDLKKSLEICPENNFINDIINELYSCEI